MAENCSETFLEGIVEVFVYESEDTKLTSLYNVPGQVMANCKMGTPLAHFVTAGEDGILADSISLKITSSVEGYGVVYTHEATISVTQSPEAVRQTHRAIGDRLCNFVFRTSAGELYLSYALPGSFRFSPTYTITDGSSSVSVSASLKSMNDVVAITPV